MLQVMLFILKLIGWILLAVLGLLVLVLAATLFTPLCYEAEVDCPGALPDLEAGVRFRIFFRLVSGSFRYQNKKFSWNIRAAWIRLGNQAAAEEAEEKTEEAACDLAKAGEEELERIAVEPEEKETKETGVKNPEAEEETKESGADSPEVTAEEQRNAAKPKAEESGEVERIQVKSMAVENQKIESVSESSAAVEEQKSETASESPAAIEDQKPEIVLESPAAVEDQKSETASESPAAIEKERPDSAGKAAGAGEEHSTGNEEQKKSLTDKIAAFFEKIKYTFDRMCAKIRILLEKKEIVTGFLTSEIHQSAFQKCLAELKKMLFRLRPRRVAGEIRFGFEDPSLTGRVLAGLSMAFPYWGDHVRCSPDFEEKVLEGRLSVGGSLRLLPAAAMGWNLLWSRNVRRTIKDARRLAARLRK
ncbi:MAG: DUF2953 domain-containing protein [Ruminococcus sp.]|uniref:DUF2953 domain-containing protein n=1 Tax=Schaedlerella arabinosiphila TaxID=2044587 RepID=A0A426DGU2_9FIRM|nr:DUF2953 domain-containing protein [Schaedlerella arabinosiphila]MCI8724276.1 DUF2953 domain-containing protein [Ruminococcus sp.]RRK31931.1 DUF2953 domain-containing protein [Schaedlerella arabinosiphila]